MSVRRYNFGINLTRGKVRLDQLECHNGAYVEYKDYEQLLEELNKIKEKQVDIFE